jgi:hypothetical protein
MENTTTQHRFVKIGNIVMWSGCFGMEQPARAVVVEIEATGQQRAKDGLKVNRVNLAEQLAVFTIKVVDGPHTSGLRWCYSDQVIEVIG